jgi:hypothetical protein
MGGVYLPLIASLMRLDAPIVLIGGFAEDAMLGGSIRRHHDDVDVLIERSSLTRGLEIFDELGFEPPSNHLRRSSSPRSGRDIVGRRDEVGRDAVRTKSADDSQGGDAGPEHDGRNA